MISGGSAASRTKRPTGEKVAALVDGQKHTDSNIAALAEMLRQLIERSGNGRTAQ